jgi:hypothetical protein
MYVLIDNVAVQEGLTHFSTAFHLMSMLIFTVMFAIIIVLLYAIIREYIEMQAENIYTLRILGASDKMIYTTFFDIVFSLSAWCVMIAFPVGLGIFSYLLHISNEMWGGVYSAAINFHSVGINLSVVVLIFLAFFVPMHVTLKKKLNTDLCDLRRQIS